MLSRWIRGGSRSPGGHGALTIAMAFSGRFASISAFAPIANPTASDWGRKKFNAYLGADESKWAAHDATLLLKKNAASTARS